MPAPAQITGTVPSADFSVKEGETISILCNVEGSPAPSALWTKISGELNYALFCYRRITSNWPFYLVTVRITEKGLVMFSFCLFVCLFVCLVS